MSENRPSSILWFERLFFASLAVTAVDLFVHRSLFFDDLGQGLEALAAILAIGFLGFGIQLLLWYFITHRTNGIARAIYAIFGAMGVVATIAASEQFTISEIAFSMVSQVLMIASIVFLYRPDADIWILTKGFRSGDEGEKLSDIFE